MPGPRTNFERLLGALVASEVRFVVIGGLAMRGQGSAHVTDDLDISYARSPENFGALVAALQPLHPQLRVPGGTVPFPFDARTFRNSLNLTLATDAGDIDLLAVPDGVDSFASLEARASEMELFGLQVRVASVDDLIAMKRAAGRPQDKRHLVELEALKQLADQRDGAEEP